MARIVWPTLARDDLKAIVDDIKADSPGYAKTFGWHIQQRVSLFMFSLIEEEVPSGHVLFPSSTQSPRTG